MAALHFSKKDFDQKVLKSDKPVLVDFWASWCQPCRMASPVVDELAEEYKDKVIIGKINVDEEAELAEKYGIMSIPVVIIFKNGKEVDRLVGFPGKGGYEEMIKKVLV